jgi:hypothetical protein
MGKGLFLTFFLVACTTSALGEKSDLPPVPDEQRQIDRMFDLTNRLRAARKIPILGLDAVGVMPQRCLLRRCAVTRR